MSRIGFISGSSLKHLAPFRYLEQRVLETNFGPAVVHVSETLAHIARHGLDPRDHILPHRINHPANLQALKDLGCSEVVGMNSTGSLKKNLPPGTIVVPHDFLQLYGTSTIFSDRPIHIAPGLTETVRHRLIRSAQACEIAVIEAGVYWQTTGPRLETKAEIAMMASFADVVGMTMAGEAVIACELALPYASLCSVDNYGHGLTDRPLNMEQISATARQNAERMGRIVCAYLEHSRGTDSAPL